jgi:hypothetical protein
MLESIPIERTDLSEADGQLAPKCSGPHGAAAGPTAEGGTLPRPRNSYGRADNAGVGSNSRPRSSSTTECATNRRRPLRLLPLEFATARRPSQNAGTKGLKPADLARVSGTRPIGPANPKGPRKRRLIAVCPPRSGLRGRRQSGGTFAGGRDLPAGSTATPPT